MSKVMDRLEQWSTLNFKDNPYGPAIPDKYLYDGVVMRDNSKSKNLSECMQNGYILNLVFNDQTKATPVEKEENISFSSVYHRLDQANQLCPSNFIVACINELMMWDMKHKVSHDHEFYCKFIGRALRSFASLMREDNLREIIDAVLKDYASKQKKVYFMPNTTVKDDMKMKTDIKVKFDKYFYRIWSYQSTEAGIDRTSKRLKRGAGTGVNLLMPISIHPTRATYGWALYNNDEVKKILEDQIVNRTGYIQSYEQYIVKVEKDPSIIKNPTVFFQTQKPG